MDTSSCNCFNEIKIERPLEVLVLMVTPIMSTDLIGDQLNQEAILRVNN